MQCSTGHAPDKTRLPNCVSGWKEYKPEDLFYNGSQLLVAVPIMCKYSKDGWYYQFEVIHIKCDIDYFAIEDSNNDSWGWDISDIDFYVVLKM